MGRFTWIILICLVASVVGLVGCSEKTTKEEALEKKVSELEKQVEKEKKEALKEEEEKRLEEEKKKEEEKLIVVEVRDPNTKEVIKTLSPKEMGFETNPEQYKEEIKKWARDLARGTEGKEGYDQRMIPDRIGENGQIIKGKPRRILEESQLTESIINASVNGGTVDLPLYTMGSGYKPEEVPKLAEEVVASFTTYFNSGVAGRTKNIELSAKAINNVILGAGDLFSFNTTVGPSDKEHGYQEAEEAVNGKLVMGIGGGICQTSSTLYNAIDKLGVKYIEKHHHSVHVGYVPKGRDATVSYGGVDFRFENSTGVPLLLKAKIKNGSLTVEVRTSKENQGIIKKG